MNIFHFKRKALGYVYRCGNPDGTDAFSGLDFSEVDLPEDAFDALLGPEKTMYKKVPGATIDSSRADLVYLQLKNQTENLKTAGNRQVFSGYAWASDKKGMGSFDAVLRDMGAKLAEKGIYDLGQIQVGQENIYQTYQVAPIYGWTDDYNNPQRYIIGYSESAVPTGDNTGTGSDIQTRTRVVGTRPALINKDTGEVVASQVSQGVYRFGDTYAGHGRTFYNLAWAEGYPILTTSWEDTNEFNDIAPALGVFLSLTGAGAALGSFITGSTGVAATILGNTIINTAINGGDLGKAVLQSAAQWAGSEVSALTAPAAANLFGSEIAGQVMGNVAGSVTTAAFLGQDIDEAMRAAAIGGAVSLGVAQIPNFSELDENLRNSITSAIQTAAQGGSAEEILTNAVAGGAMAYGLSQIDGYDQIPAKYQKIVEGTLARGIGTGDFGGAALQGLISATATYVQDTYNRDRVTQYLKDTGALPTGDYDQLTFDEQAAVDGIVEGNRGGFLFSDASAKKAADAYLYAGPQDVNAAFQKYFGDVPNNADPDKFYSALIDAGIVDIEDGKLVPGLAYIGTNKQYVDDEFSRFAIDLESAFQFDPDLDLDVVKQVYGYNNAEDALAGYLDRVETGKVISNMDDYNAAVEVLNSINKYPNGDPLDAFNEAKGDVGITPEVIESIYPGVTYGEFVQRLDGAYASGDDVIQQFKDITGREPTFEEIATYQGKPEWVTERVIQTNFDRDSVTFDGTGYETAERAAAAARDAGYLAFKWGVSEYQLGAAEAKKELRGVASTNEAFALALTRLNKNQTFTAPDGKTYKVDIPESEKPYNGTSAETKYDAAVSAFVEGKDKFIFGGKIYLVPDDMAERMVIDGMQPTDAQRKYVEESAAEATAPDLVDLTNVARTSIPDIDPDDPEAQLQLTGGLNALESGDAMRKLEGLGLSVAGAVLKAGAGIGHMISPDFKEVELSEDDKALLSAMTGKPVEAFDGPVSSQNLEDTWLYKAGAELQDRGEAAYPQWLKNERAEVFRRLEEAGSEYYDPNISPEIDMQNGMVGETALGGWIKSQYAKGAELFNLATEYPQAVLSIGLEEGGEEILPWAIGGVAYRMGRLSMTGVVTGQSALDIGEATVGGYEEAKQIAFANGASWDEAVAAGSRAGLLAGMAAGAIEPVFNYTLAKTIFDGIGKDLISGITKESFRQVASNQVQGAVENFVAQGEAKGYDNIDLNAVSTNAFIEAIVGSAVTAGLMSGSAIASGFVGTDAAGNPVSYDQFKNGADVANFDLSGLRLEAANGAQLSLGQVGASVVAATPELTGVLVTDDNPYSIEIQDALVFDADEQADWLAERGLGGFGADAYGDVIAGADTELDATNALNDWADPLYMDRDEAQAYLQNRGYQGTPEEVDALLRDNGNAVPEAEAETRIDQYVDDHTVTKEELRDQLLAENPTLTEDEIESYAQQGANVNQDQVIADAVAAVDSGYRTEQEVRDRFAELGLSRITDADAARFSGDIAEGDTFGVDTEAYLGTASQNLFMDFLNSGTLTDAVSESQVREIINSAISTIPEGITTSDVVAAVNQELAKLPDYATPQDVQDAIDTAIGQAATYDADGNVVTEATGVYANLAAETGRLGEDIADVGADVNDIQKTLGTPAEYDEDGNLVSDATGFYKQFKDLGFRDQEILGVIGLPATEESESTGLYKTIDEASQRGIDAVDALGQIVGYPASVDENGDVVESTGLFGVLDAVKEQNEEQYGDLTRQNQELSNLLGKPAQDITQADIDMLNQMVSGDVETDTAYDANQDGVIDQSDIDILTGVLAGTNVDWQAPEESYWAPTGVYGEMAGMQSDFVSQLADMEARQLAEAQQAEQRNALRMLAQSAQTQYAQMMPALQKAAEETGKATPIYGGQSMGFTPGGGFNPLAFRSFLRGQDKPGGNKMAQGGYVEDDFDDLLRMLQA